MPTPIPTAEYPSLMELINDTYEDKLESITVAQVEDDGDTITAVGKDGVKNLAIKVSSTGIQYRLLNPDDIKGDVAEPKQSAFSLGSGALNFAAAEPDVPTQLTDRMNRTGGRIVADWLASVQDMIEGSTDLAEVGDKLLELYPQMSSANLVKLLEQTSIISGMAGYLSAQEDVGD